MALRVFIASVSLICLLLWLTMILIVFAAGEQERIDSLTVFRLTVPIPFFLFYFLSCFSFIQGHVLKVGGILANVLILPYIGACFANGVPGAIVALLFFGFMGLWYAMFRRRTIKP